MILALEVSNDTVFLEGDWSTLNLLVIERQDVNELMKKLQNPKILKFCLVKYHVDTFS